MYGNRIRRMLSGRPRSLVSEITLAPYGNVILIVGREYGDEETGLGFEKSEHVVLSPQEALDFAYEVMGAACQGARQALRHGYNVEQANLIARREERLAEDGGVPA